MAITNIKTAFRAETHRLREVQRRNLQVFLRQPWREISGSFGDLGTLIPILVALSNNKPSSISLSSTLVFSGLANILTGACFGIPLPVQPMKAIAAIAIAENYTAGQLAAAGLFVAGVIGLLGITGLLRWFTRLVPVPIVKGIQMGTGLQLMISAGLQVHGVGFLGFGTGTILVVMLVLALVCTTRPSVPFVLIIVLLQIPLIFQNRGTTDTKPQFSFWAPSVLVPSLADFRLGAINAGIGQIPLTTLNSIVAVTYLAEDLFPDQAPPSVTAVSISVSMMNLAGCWFGAMPVCHGSGGLAAQYQFGARSGSSIIILGLIKLTLGLFASQLALSFCESFLRIPLGILLFLAGLGLVKMGESLNTVAARDLQDNEVHDADDAASGLQKALTSQEKTRRWILMTVTVGALLAMKNDGVGFLAGLLAHGRYKYIDWLENNKTGREGQIQLEDESSRARPHSPSALEP